MSQSTKTPYTLFISDLHLNPNRPQITENFFQFLQNQAKHSEALYILGDFFEYWIGDDDLDNPHTKSIIHHLKALTNDGLPIYFIHGNRDFLINDGFSKATGCQILPDPFMISLYGKKVLLSHGDALCTDDVAYQRFRKLVRHPFVIKIFLSLPLVLRRKIAVGLRQNSKKQKSNLAQKQENLSYLDVNQEAVNTLIKTYDADILIHGHTHQSGVHKIDGFNKEVSRIVLGDWHEKKGSVLKCTPHDNQLLGV